MDNFANNWFFHIVADLPALFIIVLITALVYRGMKESEMPVT
jgi:hypothetical protein